MPRSSNQLLIAIYILLVSLSCACQLLFGWDMDRATFDGKYSLAQTLAQGWMRVNGLDNLGGGQFAAHGHRIFADEIGGIGSNDVRAQDFVVFADDDFSETLGLIYSDCLANGSPGEALHARVRILIFGLRLCQADIVHFGDGVVWFGFHRIINEGLVVYLVVEV